MHDSVQNKPPLFTKSFGILVGAHFLQSLGWTSMVLLPLYLNHLSANRLEIGLIVAAAKIGGIASRPLVGRSLDTWGRKATLIVGTIMIASGMGLIWFVESTGPMIYLSRVIFGVGVGACFTGYFTFAADLVPESRRTEGLALFGVSGLLPMAGMPLMEQLGVRGGDLQWFLPATGLVVGSSLLFLFVIQEPPSQGKREKFSFAAVINAVTQKQLQSVWLATVIFAALVAMFLAFIGVTGKARGLEHPSSLWLTYSFGAVGARLLGAGSLDRLGPSRLIPPALFLYILAATVVAFAQSSLTFYIAGILGGIAHGYCFPLLASQVTSRNPPELRGSAIAFYTLLWDLSGLLLTPVLGLVANQFSDRMMYLGAALISLGLMPLWFRLEQVTKKNF
ncbi:MAG: MFS transporter [Myxococcota bacterium]|nr:MFS transporter [Myxococcota bacterium]